MKILTASKILITILVISLIINISLGVVIYNKNNLIDSQKLDFNNLVQKFNEETDKQAKLDECIASADSKYEQTWNSLCELSNNDYYCLQFVGSPKDIEFSKIRSQEKEACLKAYSN